MPPSEAREASAKMVVQIIHKDRVRTREFYVSTVVEHPSVWRMTPDEPLTWGHAVRGGVGYAYGVTQPIAIPDDTCEFRAFVGLKDGCNLTDGVTFSVFVLDGEEHLVASEPWARCEWKQISADLSAFRGRTIRLKLAADGGPGDDSTADWASWGEPRIVLKHPVTRIEVGH